MKIPLPKFNPDAKIKIKAPNFKIRIPDLNKIKLSKFDKKFMLWFFATIPISVMISPIKIFIDESLFSAFRIIQVLLVINQIVFFVLLIRAQNATLKGRLRKIKEENDAATQSRFLQLKSLEIKLNDLKKRNQEREEVRKRQAEGQRWPGEQAVGGLRNRTLLEKWHCMYINGNLFENEHSGLAQKLEEIKKKQHEKTQMYINRILKSPQEREDAEKMKEMWNSLTKRFHDLE